MKVRFAPSPTGFLHIGGARTALFNWMYARAQKGSFVLRIEDTDLQRSKKEYEEEILQSMKWLGIDWDEIYYQSKRFDLYREHAQKLLNEGKAYEKDGAILMPTVQREIKLYDLIRGEVTFDTSNFIVFNEDKTPVLDKNGDPQLKDEVLIKADGSAAYSFCNVVDDALMGITCVVRGEDHIPNTPKQIMMYEALGFKPPKYAHLPLILGEDGSRLSKRTGSVAVSDYKKQGFLPDALVNYLMLLGWAPGNDQEIISMDVALKKFSIKKIHKSAATFAMDKLNWISGQYFKASSTENLMDFVLDFLKDKGSIYQEIDRKRLENIVDLYKSRIVTLDDFVRWTDYAFTDDFQFEADAKEKHLLEDRSKEIASLVRRFESLEVFDSQTTHEAYKDTAEEMSFKPGDLIHPLRVALTGKTIGPSLFEIIGWLGRDVVIDRLKKTF